MKKLLSVLILLMVAILMTLTRPDKERHKEAMLKAIEEYVDEESKDRLGDNVLAKISKGVVMKTAETALNSKLNEHNYFLCNTTSVRLKGKDNTLSLGVFGMVFTFDKEMIRDKLDEALKTKEYNQTERETAKQSAKELKKLQKEQRKRERQLEKEKRKHERELAKERKRKEKELRKEQKRREKEARKKQREKEE
jgi:hypothetical protein